MRDVTTQVHQLIQRVPALKQKLTEVEQYLQRELRFHEGDLTGGAGGSANYTTGSVVLNARGATSLDIIGEEVLHWHRRARGYPIVVPLRGSPFERRSLTQLAGHFDEYAFFPFLEEIGLQPRQQFSDWRSSAVYLESELQSIAQDDSADWRVMLPVIFVQARLIYPDAPNGSRLRDLYESRVLRPYRESGEQLCDEVTRAATEPPVEVTTRLSRCVHEHLRVSDESASVRIL